MPAPEKSTRLSPTTQAFVRPSTSLVIIPMPAPTLNTRFRRIVAPLVPPTKITCGSVELAFVFVTTLFVTVGFTQSRLTVCTVASSDLLPSVAQVEPSAEVAIPFIVPSVMPTVAL